MTTLATSSFNHGVFAQVTLTEVHGFGWKRVQVGLSHGRRTRVDGKILSHKFDDAILMLLPSITLVPSVWTQIISLSRTTTSSPKIGRRTGRRAMCLPYMNPLRTYRLVGPFPASYRDSATVLN